MSSNPVPPPLSPPPRVRKYAGQSSSSNSLKSMRFTRSSSSMTKASFRHGLNTKDSARMSVRMQKASVITKYLWINDQETNEWDLCQMLQQNDSVMTLQNGRTGQTFQYDTAFGEVFQANEHVVPDMTYLRHLHEPGILHNLRERLLVKQPYTFMGSVLISVNPFEWLPPANPLDFAGKSMESDRPHPYAIAEMSIQQICVKKPKDQSVVISGESGAGKTESAKMVLNYIVSRATGNLASAGHSGSSTSSIERRLVESSPVLEAFGNAKTGRNANSSRFGKYLKVYFLPKQNQTRSAPGELPQARQIAGAAIETYLLEKSRVVGQAPNEGNYHIFYQLLAAKEANLSSLSNCPLSSTSISNYQILGSLDGNQKAQRSDSGTNTARDFSEVENAFRVLQLPDSKIQSIWACLAAVLEIGNIVFVDEETPQGTVARIQNSDQCERSASLLKVTPLELQATLTQRVMTARGESYTISLNSKDAVNARNAICKALYAATFTSIVSILNQALDGEISSANSSELTSIGVLDIFGFESFPHNEFEQLLINYANEELQSAFNRHVFQNELRLYQEENISSDLTLDQCPNNSGCVSLLSAPKISVMAILQTSSQMANASDELFFENVNKSFEAVTDLELKKFFVKAHPKDKKAMFTIKHFAGKVSYHIGPKGSNTWLLKNNDDVPQDLTNMIQRSADEYIQSLVYCGLAQVPTSAGAGRRASLRKQSIADGFMLSMTSLVKTLSDSTCSFIRCIKPNPELKPITFNNKYTLEQIRALGLVQVCSVMKIGLPTRISFPELKEALGPVAKEAEILFQGLPEETFIASLLFAFDIPKDVYQLGRTKLFFKSGQLEALDRILSTDFVAKKDEIMERLNAALKARNDCEEAVRSLREKFAEVELLQKSSHENVKILASSLVEVQTAVKNLALEHRSTTLSTEEVLSVLNSSNCLISDTLTYGQDVTTHEAYPTIKKLVDDALERLSLSELQWKSLDQRLLEVETFCLSDPESQMSQLCGERTEDLGRFEAEINDVNEQIHLVVLEANRCDIKKVQVKTEEAEHELSLIKYHLKKHETALGEITQMKKSTLSRVESLKCYLIDVNNFVRDSVEIGKRVTSACNEIRQKTDELRAQIAKDLEEKLRMEEEARKREEEERRRREEEERAYQAEMERLREEEEREEARKAAEEEAKRILKEQKRLSSKILPMKKGRSNGFLAEDSDEELDADTVSELAHQLVHNYENYDLPEGWEKALDPATKIPYYVNTLTQTSQWSRPSSPATNLLDDDHTEVVKVINDERKLFDSISLMSADGGSEMTSLTDERSLSRRDKLLQDDRQDSFVSFDDPDSLLVEDDIEEPESKVITPEQIPIHIAPAHVPVHVPIQTPEPEEPEPEPISKRGILQKQGGFFGMWSKKFFLLEDDILSYYETSQAYVTGVRASKQMVLTASSELSFTKMSHCFKVKTDDMEWVLMSENKDLMREWVQTIRSVITRLYDARIKRITTTTQTHKKK